MEKGENLKETMEEGENRRLHASALGIGVGGGTREIR